MGRCKYCGKDLNECSTYLELYNKHALCLEREQELMSDIKRWLSDERGE